jgi:CheY-like chemotaxis protein
VHFAPRVALLDIGMPGFNDYEVARLERQRDRDMDPERIHEILRGLI